MVRAYRYQYKRFFVAIILLAIIAHCFYVLLIPCYYAIQILLIPCYNDIQEDARIWIEDNLLRATLSKSEQLNKKWVEFYEQVSFIRNITPKDSLIILPPHCKLYPIGNIGLSDYFLFPRFTVHKDRKRVESHKGPVYLVRMKMLKYKGEYIREYKLDEGFSLLLVKEREKETKLQLVGFSEIESNLLNTTLALLKLLLIVGSGVYIVARYFAERSRIGFLATSFLVGTIINGVFYIFLSFLRINFGELFQFLFLVALSTPGIIFLMEPHGHARGSCHYAPLGATSRLAFQPRPWPWFSGRGIKQKRSIKYSKGAHSYNKIAFIIVSLFFAGLFIKNFFTPITEWDACAIWGLRAKTIFALHNLTGLGRWGEAGDYVPLLPILMSQVAIGGERMVQLIFPLLALCLYANVYDELSETTFPPMLKILLPLLIFHSAVFFRHSLEGDASLALAVFTTKSVTILSKSLKDNSGKTWLALSIMLCGVALVRPEGAVYFFYAALIIYILGRFQTNSFKNFSYLLIPLSSCFLWKLYSRLILKNTQLWGMICFSAVKELITVTHQLNPGVIAVNLVNFSISPKYWGTIPILFILLCLFRRKRLIKRNPAECLFILMGVIGLLAYSYTSFLPDFQHFVTTGYPRYFMTFVSIMFIVVLREIDTLILEYKRTA